MVRPHLRSGGVHDVWAAGAGSLFPRKVVRNTSAACGFLLGRVVYPKSAKEIPGSSPRTCFWGVRPSFTHVSYPKSAKDVPGSSPRTCFWGHAWLFFSANAFRKSAMHFCGVRGTRCYRACSPAEVLSGKPLSHFSWTTASAR